MHGMHIRFLGAFHARRADSPLPALSTRKAILVLLVLALRAGRSVDRSYLTGTLWPDSTDTEGAMSLRGVLSKLRTWLGPDAERIESPTRQTLRLNLENLFVDVLAFDRAVSAWEKKGNIENAETAVALYGGSLLEGWSDVFLVNERERRSEQCRTLLEALGNRSLSEGNIERALTLARRVERMDPLSQSAQRLLYEALARSGDIAGMLRTYRDFRIRLYSEMRMEPDAETTALVEHLRNSPTAQVKIPPVVPPTEQESPRRSHRLPVPLTSLIGRTQEVEAVATLLKTARLVTLTGTGGVGKTRLAIQVAEECGDDLVEERYFVPLAPLSEASQVASAAITALGLREESHRPAHETLCDFLQTRRALLIFDNCEHLLEISAQLADQLLSACPNLRLLTTSREALRLPGEQVFSVPSLPMPEGTPSDTDMLLEYASARLFVERARAVSPDFHLTSANAPAVSDICRRLDGLPLALELAAARIPMLTAPQIAVRLQDRFTLLTGSRAPLPRQRSLQAALDWSYDLLSPAEQLLLQRLSVFIGDFSLEAAQSITAPLPDYLTLLTGLVEKSLVVPVVRDGDVRYRLLETIREYAGARLVEKRRYQRRHLVYFSWFVEKATRDRSGERMGVYLDQLMREYPNLELALQRGSTTPEFSIRALRLAVALGDFWRMRAPFHVGAEYLSLLLARTGGNSARLLHAVAQENLAALNLYQGRLSESYQHFAITLTLFRTLGDVAGEARQLRHLGLVEHERGNNGPSRDLVLQALTLAREIGDRKLESRCLHNLGNVAKEQEQFAEANTFYGQSLAIMEEFQDAKQMSNTYICLGLVAERQGDLAAAADYCEQSLALAKSLGDQNQVAETMSFLAFVYQKQGERSHARELMLPALQMMLTWGQSTAIGRTYDFMAHLSLEEQDYITARHYLHEGLPHVLATEDRRLLDSFLAASAILLAGENRWEDTAVACGAREAVCALLEQQQYSVHYLQEEEKIQIVRAEAEQVLGCETFARLLELGSALPLDTVWSRIDSAPSDKSH